MSKYAVADVNPAREYCEKLLYFIVAMAHDHWI